MTSSWDDGAPAFAEDAATATNKAEPITTKYRMALPHRRREDHRLKAFFVNKLPGLALMNHCIPPEWILEAGLQCFEPLGAPQAGKFGVNAVLLHKRPQEF
jgi:hypothetical protein